MSAKATMHERFSCFVLVIITPHCIIITRPVLGHLQIMKYLLHGLKSLFNFSQIVRFEVKSPGWFPQNILLHNYYMFLVLVVCAAAFEAPPPALL